MRVLVEVPPGGKESLGNDLQMAARTLTWFNCLFVCLCVTCWRRDEYAQTDVLYVCAGRCKVARDRVQTGRLSTLDIPYLLTTANLPSEVCRRLVDERHDTTGAGQMTWISWIHVLSS